MAASPSSSVTSSPATSSSVTSSPATSSSVTSSPATSSSVTSSPATSSSATSSSSSPSDKEKTNHYRLSMLLTDIGRRVLQDVFDSIHPPSSLIGVLYSGPVYTQLSSLKMKKFLYAQQWDTLFPSSGGSVTSNDFDITLLFLLLRNICGLKPPAQALIHLSATGWGTAPSPTDRSIGANLVRIKRCRNELYAHRVRMALTDSEFNSNWAEIEAALLGLGGLGYSGDIQKLKYATVDPENEKMFQTLLSRSWEEMENAVRKLEKDLLSRASIILIVLVVVSAVLYQLYVPGTSYRYAVCRRGSIDGHDMWYTFNTFTKQTPRVHGIEFEWEKLKENLGLKFDKYHGTGMHYYLNLDRCAYGGIVAVKSYLDGTPQVGGPEVFAVDHTCTYAYYEMEGKWHVYQSGRDFKCVPPYK